MVKAATSIANLTSIIEQTLASKLASAETPHGHLPIARVTKDIWITNDSQLSK